MDPACFLIGFHTHAQGRFRQRLYGRILAQQAQFLISSVPDWLLDTLQKYRLDLDIKHTVLTREYVEALHAAGIKVNTWTVNTPEDAQRVIDMGVDFITTNILE